MILPRALLEPTEQRVVAAVLLLVADSGARADLALGTAGGRAPRTIDAYARGLAEYLDVCERENVDPATANRAHVTVFVRELTRAVAALRFGHGLCSYTSFEQCQHRMACAKCDFYIPKNSSKARLLEAKTNLQRMLVAIPAH